MMQKYAREFTMYLDSQGIKYTEQNENVVKVIYEGENLNTISIFVIFDEDGENLVQIRSWEIINFKNSEAKAYIACNEMNDNYRWLKFYIDGDADIVAEMDAVIDMDTCGEVCLSLVRRAVRIIDKAYPTFAKARWS